MTRASYLSVVSCAALLAAVAAYGCGSSSISSDAGGTGGRGGAQGGTGGRVGTGGIVGGGTGGAAAGTGGRTGVDGGGTAGANGNDAGPTQCATGSTCTTGFTCEATCFAGTQQGTRACTCSAQNRVVCPAGAGTCMVPDAGGGAVDARPPFDAAPPPADAGLNCAGNVMTNRACVVGTSLPCTRRANGMTQACTCGAGADGGDVWTCI